MARACAAQSNATFLKLAGPQLVQMFIGDGAKLVRDAFALAREKAPTIIFIDELDAIGTKRFDSEKAGDREVQRTLLLHTCFWVHKKKFLAEKQECKSVHNEHGTHRGARTEAPHSLDR